MATNLGDFLMFTVQPPQPPGQIVYFILFLLWQIPIPFQNPQSVIRTVVVSHIVGKVPKDMLKIAEFFFCKGRPDHIVVDISVIIFSRPSF